MGKLLSKPVCPYRGILLSDKKEIAIGNLQ